MGSDPDAKKTCRNSGRNAYGIFTPKIQMALLRRLTPFHVTWISFMPADLPDTLDKTTPRSLRRRTLKRGLVTFAGGFMTLECTVRNLSETGARLVMENGAVPPDQFVLAVEVDGFEVDCQVIHRAADEFGVRFVGQRRATRQRRQQTVVSTGAAEGRSIRRQVPSPR